MNPNCSPITAFGAAGLGLARQLARGPLAEPPDGDRRPGPEGAGIGSGNGGKLQTLAAGKTTWKALLLQGQLFMAVRSKRLSMIGNPGGKDLVDCPDVP
jgi:hypothetical protein